MAEAGAVLTAQAKKIENLSTEHTIKAQEFLRDASGEVKAYLSKNLDTRTYHAVSSKQEAVASTEDAFAVLTNAEKQALRRYTDQDYIRINKVLRGEIVDDVAADQARFISTALLKLPRYQETVFRGTPDNFLELLRNKYLPNFVVLEPAFTSASSVKGAHFDKAPVQFIIRSRTGRLIESLSTHASEREVLLPAGSSFLVKSNELSNGIRIIHMEEL